MRKHSKFITILLSALLAVCLMQTVFVQAFATENSATPDEPTGDLRPVSMKVVKAPESVTANDYENRITDSTFWSNVVLHIVYSNGEEYDVNCDGIDSEDGIVPPIAEINGYAGNITVHYYCEDDTVNFTVDYCYAYDEEEEVTCAVSADFSAEKKVDPHTIVRYELTKLPDMVFTKPLFTGSRDDISTGEEWNEWMNSLDVNNSISNHIDGMEITYYYANGEKRSVVVNSSNLKSFALMPWFAMYRVENYGECVDEYGNYLVFQVDDLGDYKFSVSLGSSDTEMIYTAKSVDNPNPSIKPVSTEDTPAKPEKPSGNISSATSDVATKDNAGNNNTTNGTANNGVVATGDFATPAIIATVMILAAAVMFVLKRKHTF